MNEEKLVQVLNELYGGEGTPPHIDWKQVWNRIPMWVHCPCCDKKTQVKVYGDTVMQNFPLYCPKCKREMRINIRQLEVTLCDVPTI